MGLGFGRNYTKDCKKIHINFENAFSGTSYMYKTDLARAVDRSLDLLGEPSKKALLFHLTHTYKIPLEGKCSVGDIESALKEILGEGALLVIASINNELGQKTR